MGELYNFWKDWLTFYLFLCDLFTSEILLPISVKKRFQEFFIYQNEF